MKLINNHRQPLALDDGTILAAANTAGSQRDVEQISERDRRRYVDTGRIAVLDDPAPPSRRKEKAQEKEAE